MGGGVGEITDLLVITKAGAGPIRSQEPGAPPRAPR